ncbi:hypothetical protein FO519_007172 [Halicephalobus sp. NKZ332]|nr:hypothetical protein FO519_007172 [Halicephalobus sp. NKZ332]
MDSEDETKKESKLPLLGEIKIPQNGTFNSGEELKKPENNILTFPLLLTVFAATIGSSFQSGWHTGCVNPIGKVASSWYNESHYYLFGEKLTNEETDFIWSLTVGIFNVGGMIGGYFACRMADNIGRRNTLMVNNSFIFTGIILMTFAYFVNFYPLLPIGRLITGCSSGIASAIVPLYITEISPITRRGTLGSVHQLTFTFSNFVSTIFGLPQIFGNAVYWPCIFVLALLPAVIQLVLLPFCPESPKYTLLTLREVDKAARDLKKLRKVPNVSLEIEMMEKEASNTYGVPNVTIPELFTNVLYRKRIIISIMLMFALQFCGITAVFFYSRQIFEDAGLTGTLPFYMTILAGFLNFAMTIVSAKLMDHKKFGRRSLHFIGLTGMFFSTLGLVFCMSLSQSVFTSSLRSLGSIGACFFVFTYIISFATGPGPIPWFYVSEIFPPHAKSSAQSITVICCWIGGSIVGMSFLPINNILGHYTFLIFTGFIGWFMFFTYKYVPETKGRTVAEIEREMGLDSIKRSISESDL